MGDIQYWQDSLINETESIQSILASVPHVTDDLERNSALDQAEKKLRSANGNKRSFKMEVRILSDISARKTYEAQIAEHEQNLSKLADDLKALRSETARSELFLGAKTDDVGKEVQNDGDAMLQDATRLQDKTAAALGNTQSLIADSKMIGLQTVDDLQRQREQIRNIDQDVMRMEDNLSRADKLIKTFGKRMATDKVIQCFACVNILLIVVVIAVAIWKGGFKGSDETEEREDPFNSSTSRMLR